MFNINNNMKLINQNTNLLDLTKLVCKDKLNSGVNLRRLAQLINAVATSSGVTKKIFKKINLVNSSCRRWLQRNRFYSKLNFIKSSLLVRQEHRGGDLGAAGLCYDNCRKETVTIRRYEGLRYSTPQLLCSAFEALACRPGFRMGQFTDLFAVDLFGQNGVRQANRFRVIYIFFSLYTLQRLLLEVRWSAGVVLPSLSYLYSAAGWAERELWDMTGIKVVNHGDLRRILTDYGFRGFPLRKDFPAVGFLQVRFDEKNESVIYEPTRVVQEGREEITLGSWGLFVLDKKVVTNFLVTDCVEKVHKHIYIYKVNGY